MQTVISESVDRTVPVLPWLKNVWYAAIWSEQLALGAVLSRTLLNQRIVMFRDAAGRPKALLDRCPHRFAPLSAGKVLDDGRIQCGYHGLEFDGTGRCVNNPHGDGKIPSAAVVPAFSLAEKHSLIWIWMGDAPPDPARIPDFRIFDDAPPLHVAERGELVLAADYRLITDNLLDLSHASYLHSGSLGNVEMASVTKTEVTQVGDCVHVSRRSPNVPMPGIGALMSGGDTGLVDKWNEIEWHPPGNMLLRQGVCAPGEPESTGTGYFGVHLLTPQTEKTTRYLFSAVRFNVRETDPAESARVREQISVIRRQAFELQDEPIIEEQARIIEEMGEHPLRPALLAIDAGAVRFRRVLDALIAREAETASRV